MNKTTFSHYGSIIAVVIILAIMVAFATPFGDYVADSSNQLISSFTAKSNASLCEANSRDYKFRPLLVSRIVSATNQSGDPLTYDALDMNSASLRSGLVAFTSGSVDELNVNNAQLLDVTVEGEYTSATITFDVGDLANEGDEIGVYHYNESTSSWEHIGNYVTSAELQITATFASLSPVALINLTKDYTVVETPDDPQQPDEPERITDLTGTKWVLNETINATSCPPSYISFVSNENNFEGIGFLFIPQDRITGLNYAIEGQDPSSVISVIAYSYDEFTGSWGWNSQSYRTIEITGGTDATNPDLIAWLEENATQSVTDLTGTKWVLNETIEYDSSFPTYDVNYNAYCESGAVASLSGLYMLHVEMQDPSVDFYCIRNTGSESFYFSNFFLGDVLYTGDGTTSMTNSANEPSFNGELFNRTIEITGGTDATNADLIAWLQANATQEATGLIVFRINNMPFLAESGMTWAQWVASAYNTSGFEIDGTSVRYSGAPLMYSNYDDVYSTDTIIKNHGYKISGGSND